jgi:hypothetical protein
MSETIPASAERRPAEAAAVISNDNSPARAPDVRAAINYIETFGERPRAFQYDPPPGVALRTGTYTPRPVLVRNGRAALGRISLDREGFQLVREPTAFTNFRDSDAVKAAYYPEVETAVKRATGATRVVVFDHNVRHAPSALAKKNGEKEPVKRAHNDYTVKSGPQRVRDLLGDEAEVLLRQRFAVVNLWRPISGPVEESPLALCDAQSIAPADLVATDLVYRDRIGETYSLAYNPAHRWFYFPQMRTDEAVLIKCYDAAEDGRARIAAHSAFDDPTSPQNARPRESIEARTLVFFD